MGKLKGGASSVALVGEWDMCRWVNRWVEEWLSVDGVVLHYGVILRVDAVSGCLCCVSGGEVVVWNIEARTWPCAPIGPSRQPQLPRSFNIAATTHPSTS